MTIQYLVVDNEDKTMTVMKIVDGKQIAAYAISCAPEDLDHMLEALVLKTPNKAYGDTTG